MSNATKNYARIVATLYVELSPGEGLEDAEGRLLKGLPEGVDCTSLASEMWVSDDDEKA